MNEPAPGGGHPTGGPGPQPTPWGLELWPGPALSGAGIRRLVVLVLVGAAVLMLIGMAVVVAGGDAGAHGWGALLRGTAARSG